MVSWDRTRRGPIWVTHGGTQRASFLLLEVLAALALTGALLAVMGAAVIAYDRANDHFWAHHQAQLAAETCIEYLRAGRPVPPPAGGVSYRVERQAGTGPWSGLTRVTVIAEVKTRHGRSVHYRLSAYLRRPGHET